MLPLSALAQVPTREELQRNQPPASPPAGEERVDASRAMARGPCPLNRDIRVAVRELRFTGPAETPLPDALAPLLAPLTTRTGDQSIAIVCDIRDEANAVLQRAGYVASVQIPPQRIADGIVRLEVVSARIVDVRVRGDAGPYEALVGRRIDALRKLDPLNRIDAERLLLQLSDVPGLVATLALLPANGPPGDVIGEITISFERYGLVSNLQNYNSRQLGRETGYLRGEVRGITGNADMAYIGLSSTFDFEEQRIVQAGYLIGLNDTNTTLALRGTYAASKPALNTITLDTDTYIGELELAHPLIRSVGANLGLIGGFEFVEQRTRVVAAAGSTPLNLDRIAAARVRLAGDRRFLGANDVERGSIAAWAEVRKGIDVFNVTRPGVITPSGYAPSRFEGDPRAFIARGQFDVRFMLGDLVELAGQVRGQWADRALLNFDEFSIGNLTIGRGYDPGSNSGDRAVAVSNELRINVLQRDSLRVQLFGFHDAVHLWNRDQNSTERDRVLRSYGAGVQLLLPRKAILDVTYARPRDPVLLTGVNRPPPDRVLVSLTMQLVPFGGRR